MEAAAATPQLRVRNLGGMYRTVLLAPGVSEFGVKEIIAAALGLAVGSFSLVNEAGEWTVPHAALAGDWNAVPHIAPPATQRELFSLLSLPFFDNHSRVYRCHCLPVPAELSAAVSAGVKN